LAVVVITRWFSFSHVVMRSISIIKGKGSMQSDFHIEIPVKDKRIHLSIKPEPIHRRRNAARKGLWHKIDATVLATAVRIKTGMEIEDYRQENKTFEMPGR
jgi:hypothetical protein